MLQHLYSLHMLRTSLLVAVLFALAQIVVAQNHPKFSLVLPPGIASENVQINYFVLGPFGGYGGYVRAEKDRESYDIDPYVDDQPAKDIKVISYLPGCEITAFEVTLSDMPVERRLDCHPLGTISFRGRALPVSMIRNRDLEIEVRYLADWSLGFFGIFDGAETQIRLGSVRPDWDGKFEIMLPDFYQAALSRNGEFEFILREVRTGNIISFLRPTEGMSRSRDSLSVQASYPTIEFTAEENK
jgi:hypothetical protein